MLRDMWYPIGVLPVFVGEGEPLLESGSQLAPPHGPEPHSLEVQTQRASPVCRFPSLSSLRA